ncbi:MAG: HupE/UreJ family protein [Alphaproteobacteria bacterium]|nr:HupE/UreJ family protein [Alphaproteobacteria bacterium]
MRLLLVILAGLCWMTGLSPIAAAHEVNPAFLELTETESGQFDVVWKQPIKDGRRLKLDPVFPEDCEGSAMVLEGAVGAVVSRWTLSCALNEGEIRVDGLDRTLTDVFVQIHRIDGSVASVVLKPAAAAFELGEETSSAPLLAYFRIGVDHIIFGYDHLLFVLGLCLLVRPAQLLLTVTAFTVAHSITLGLSTLAGITLPGPPVESVIALSLILLAREAITLQRGGRSLTSQYPWAIAFGFGLIHGFGFAGALADIGLPKDQEIWALLLFNLGVEAGQVAFVIALAVLAAGLTYVARNWLSRGKIAAAYLVGVSGTIWLVERVVAF